jgi:hypothetical protein
VAPLTPARRTIAVSIPRLNADSSVPSPKRSLRMKVVSSFARSSSDADATAAGSSMSRLPSALPAHVGQSKTVT